MNQKKSTEEIFEKLLRSECSPEEVDHLLLALQTDQNVAVKDLVLEQLQSPVQLSELSFEEAAKLSEGLKSILGNKGISSDSVTKTNNKRNSFAKFWYAAAVVIFLIGGAWWLAVNNLSVQPQLQEIANFGGGDVTEDFVPGGNKAILMTGDGRAIDLEESVNTQIKDGLAIIKPSAGSVEYNLQQHTPASELAPVFHTLIIPRGGKYHVTLSDGTKVWLNAASTLRFPEVFQGNERLVELTGEGYFEVAKNKDMPFKVKINEMTVQVTGTHFNVNGYPENNGVKTTLLEGGVNVVTKSDSATLFPGEQIAYRNNRLEAKDKRINVDQVVAWKNNHFDFTNETLSNIARQLSRWYQVDIIVDDAIASTHMSGIISRENKISKVLDVFSFSADIDYKIQNNNTIYLFKK